MKPLIGLVGRRKTGAQVEGLPAELRSIDIDVYLADYARGVHNTGGLPIHLPLDADPGDYIDHLDGIVLTGGADVDPYHYEQAPDGNGDYEPIRDGFELSLLGHALDREVPVLGICRGIQLINVHAGGSLQQHVPTHARYDVPPSEFVHEVEFTPGSGLEALFGPKTSVNSLHHQTVDRVGDGLIVTGRADDGTIEGLEQVDQKILAVQWHPEMLGDRDPVFDWLTKMAST